MQGVLIGCYLAVLSIAIDKITIIGVWLLQVFIFSLCLDKDMYKITRGQLMGVFGLSLIILLGSGCSKEKQILATDVHKGQEIKNDVASPKAINQLKEFENYLEYTLVQAQINCDVLSTYNSVLLIEGADSQSFQQAFPEKKEIYKEKCKSSYLEVLKNENILIAEPELKSLRLLLTSYTEEVKGLSQYALEGGHQGSRISNYEKKIDNLRTLSREEIIKLKNKYNTNQ